MAEQRLYWIKLTDRFMTSDTVDFLMSQKNGAQYVVLYQMLCLHTVNQHGELARKIGEMIIPYDEEKIRRDCKFFTADTIKVALSLYKNLGLIYEDDDGILKIADFDRLLGSETASAERVRSFRERERKALQCNENETYNETQAKRTMKRIEKDKDKEKDIYSSSACAPRDIQIIFPTMIQDCAPAHTREEYEKAAKEFEKSKFLQENFVRLSTVDRHFDKIIRGEYRDKSEIVKEQHEIHATRFNALFDNLTEDDL